MSEPRELETDDLLRELGRRFDVPWRRLRADLWGVETVGRHDSGERGGDVRDGIPSDTHDPYWTAWGILVDFASDVKRDDVSSSLLDHHYTLQRILEAACTAPPNTEGDHICVCGHHWERHPNPTTCEAPDCECQEYRRPDPSTRSEEPCTHPNAGPGSNPCPDCGVTVYFPGDAAPTGSGEDWLEKRMASLVRSFKWGSVINCNTMDDRARDEAIRRLRSTSEGDADLLSDPTSAWYNLRTCVCGGDASEHGIPGSCDGFDPDWVYMRQWLERLHDRLTRTSEGGRERVDIKPVLREAGAYFSQVEVEADGHDFRSWEAGFQAAVDSVRRIYREHLAALDGEE